MAELIRNLYVPSGTGRPGVLTNVQLTEVEPDLGRRTSNFVPYSTLYHAVYPRQVSFGDKFYLFLKYELNKKIIDSRWY